MATLSPVSDTRFESQDGLQKQEALDLFLRTCPSEPPAPLRLDSESGWLRTVQKIEEALRSSPDSGELLRAAKELAESRESLTSYTLWIPAYQISTSLWNPEEKVLDPPRVFILPTTLFHSEMPKTISDIKSMQEILPDSRSFAPLQKKFIPVNEETAHAVTENMGKSPHLLYPCRDEKCDHFALCYLQSQEGILYLQYSGFPPESIRTVMVVGRHINPISRQNNNYHIASGLAFDQKIFLTDPSVDAKRALPVEEWLAKLFPEQNSDSFPRYTVPSREWEKISGKKLSEGPPYVVIGSHIYRIPRYYGFDKPFIEENTPRLMAQDRLQLCLTHNKCVREHKKTGPLSENLSPEIRELL